MSQGGQPPVFLERRGYRRRRMMDAQRLLPVAGLLLWMFPLFWPTGGDDAGAPQQMSMSDAVQYVFVVWLLLIAAAFVLWRVLRTGPETGEDAPRESR